jgi:succinate dehydrogenase/fumarate reductase flavoprotein subunit
MMGHTLDELASVTGIDREALRATIEHFNQASRSGVDLEFGRGNGAYDRASVEPSKSANPCLGPLDRAPFYAVKVYPGCVGTFAGLMANENAEVLNEHGEAIVGLYVVGNDMSSITGGDYIGGGCTLGPGMTFGYVAALHAAKRATTGKIS